MTIKTYTKQELAMLYFPDATPEVACAHLKRWIHHCKPLLQQLTKSGYSRHTKLFNPLQVAQIIENLGEP